MLIYLHCTASFVLFLCLVVVALLGVGSSVDSSVLFRRVSFSLSFAYMEVRDSHIGIV